MIMLTWKKTVAFGLVLVQLGLGSAFAAAPDLSGLVVREPGTFWRLDAANKPEVPRNYRVDESLRMSGSAQPSVLALTAMLHDLHKRGVTPQQLVLVDLRQEDHGFFNGTAVSWYGKDNWGNVGRSEAWITKDEEKRLTAAEEKNMTYYDLGKKKVPVPAGTTYVAIAPTEEQLASIMGIGYKRFPSTDHIWPAASEIDQFLAWSQTLPKDAWLHFHCEAGVGRTTAFMTIWDIWHNVQKDSLESICARETALGGQDILHLTSKNKTKELENADKQYHLRQFYEYAKAYQSGQTQEPWSAYLQQHS